MKKPKTLKDVWYCWAGYCDSMCVKQATPSIQTMVREWITYLESEEKKFIRKMTRDSKKWNEEYEQGMHQDTYNHCEVWLSSVETMFAKKRAQVKILKEIFDIHD